MFQRRGIPVSEPMTESIPKDGKLCGNVDKLLELGMQEGGKGIKKRKFVEGQHTDSVEGEEEEEEEEVEGQHTDHACGRRKFTGRWETKVHRKMGDRRKKTNQRVMKDKWRFLNDGRMDHELIFKELAIWEGQDVPFNRIAWVQVLGVPLQLWEGNTFDWIGQLLGKVVEFSFASNKTGNLSFDEIDILVSNPLRISTSMNLEWGGKSYQVRLEESIRCWDPSFLTMPESSVNFSLDRFSVRDEEVLWPRFAQGHLNQQANLRIRAGVLGESHNSRDGDPAPDPNDVGNGGIDSSNRDPVRGNNPSEWESELGAEESRGGKGIKEGQDLPTPNFTQVDLNASPDVSASLDQKRGPGSRNSE
ncbi:hypothetical protein L1987_18912 [Smallanthus sonchifolius]|uniref:Uncharacterized protein n=1 Tax=Smallanthus sonchifolius TaxID=185202 RepID=A0ACB9J313_9ASTR|nr:hypothetical protein L1987_18912 [Smallanthus sonchifolius]